MTEASTLRKRVLVVGLGGLGCPVLSVLSRAPGLELVLCDDDEVELSNLHRQTLYGSADVGHDKLETAQRVLIERGAAPGSLVPVRTRLLPENARQLVSGVDLVVEGSDNFATKFLAADAAHLEGKPIVHGAAVRFVATVWAVSAQGAPCYRCLFESVPEGADQSCAVAGVMGPVVGMAGALMAELALRVLAGGSAAYGELWSYDGLRDTLRRVPVQARTSCELCSASPSIRDTDERLYLGANSAA